MLALRLHSRLVHRAQTTSCVLMIISPSSFQFSSRVSEVRIPSRLVCVCAKCNNKVVISLEQNCSYLEDEALGAAELIVPQSFIHNQQQQTGKESQGDKNKSCKLKHTHNERCVKISRLIPQLIMRIFNEHRDMTANPALLFYIKYCKHNSHRFFYWVTESMTLSIF